MKNKYTFKGITFKGNKYDHATEAKSYGEALRNVVGHLGYKTGTKLSTNDYAKEIKYLKANLEKGHGSVTKTELPSKPTQLEIPSFKEVYYD